jgi:hypothetical protein
MPTPPRPPLRHRLRPVHWLLVDGLAAAAYGLFTFGILGVRESNLPLAVTATGLVAVTVPLARWRPLIAASVALAVFWCSPISPRYG